MLGKLTITILICLSWSFKNKQDGFCLKLLVSTPFLCSFHFYRWRWPRKSGIYRRIYVSYWNTWIFCTTSKNSSYYTGITKYSPSISILPDSQHSVHVTKHISSVQFVSDSATPWITARQASLSITNSQSSPRLMSIESVMPSSHLILCRPVLLLPPVPPSIRVFSNESTLHMRWPKYGSFSFNISPFNEHPGLISFRMDWLDLLAVQGTLKSLLQHHSSKASIRRSAFFTVQLSHLYMTTGKTIAFD